MLVRMSFGMVFFGFFTSPFMDNAVSAPIKAKNSIKEVSPISFIEGAVFQYKFAISMLLNPININTIKGVIFAIVINLTKLIPFLTPIMFI